MIPKAQCAYVSVPLDYDYPTGTQIRIFVKRLVQSAATPKPALWILNGGPGQPQSTMEDVVDNLNQYLSKEYDLYLPEHRGVGRSTRLSCVAPQAETLGSEGGIIITANEMNQCSAAFKLEYAANTTKFSSLESARDLYKLMSEQKAAGQNQYVYGWAYGSLWATRLMQLDGADALVSGLILDSVVSTSAPAATPQLKSAFDRWDYDMNAVGLQLMNRCGNNTFCQGKLSTDTNKYVADVYEKVFMNATCKSLAPEYNVTADELRYTLGVLLTKPGVRELIPAILYRLNRCDADLDVPTLQHFFDVTRVMMPTPTCVPLSSDILFNNIVFSELWSGTQTYEQLWANYNSTFFAYGAYKWAGVKRDSAWPLYTLGAKYDNVAFKTNNPVLLLQGDLDSQIPYEYAVQQYTNIDAPADKKRLLKFPDGVHGILATSAVNNSATVTCGMQIVSSFLKNAGDLSKLDSSCIDFLVRLGFKGNDETNMMFLGVSDIFEDAFEPPEVIKTVNLYLFIGVEAGTAVLAIIIICCLIYYIVQLKDKESQYENLEN